MSSSMNTEEAKRLADKMSYAQAVHFALFGKCIPYKKAVRIKLMELLEIAEKADEQTCDTCIHNDLPWYEEPCDSCCRAHSGYERRE